MKKRFISFIIMIVALAAIISTICITKFPDEIKNESNRFIYNDPMMFYTTYNDHVNTIEELKSKSEAIVLAIKSKGYI